MTVELVFVDLSEDALKTLRDECTLLVGGSQLGWLEDVISTFLLGCWEAITMNRDSNCKVYIKGMSNAVYMIMMPRAAGKQIHYIEKQSWSKASIFFFGSWNFCHFTLWLLNHEHQDVQ